MDQPTFSDLEYQGKKRKTRRELFLERMDGLIPWQLLEDRIRPFYPKAGRGRQPYPLSVMLRTHCVQLCYNLSNPGMEDLPYAPDAWYDPDSVKVGYEISFTRHFYKPQPLRPLEEIRADILALERETVGLLCEILEGVTPNG